MSQTPLTRSPQLKSSYILAGLYAVSMETNHVPRQKSDGARTKLLEAGLAIQAAFAISGRTFSRQSQAMRSSHRAEGWSYATFSIKLAYVPVG